MNAFSPTTEQERVVGHHGHAFVTACPGGGKTRVMVERARAVLPNLTANQGVLFLSFTDAAAGELGERLREEGLIGVPMFPSFVGTFDSFLWNFVVLPFGVPGTDADPVLIPDQGQLSTAPHSSMRPFPIGIFDEYTGTIIPEAARRANFPIDDAGKVTRYEQSALAFRIRLRDMGHLGYGAVRQVVHDHLKDKTFRAALGAALAARFPEAIVDEAQDCNPNDLEIVRWLRNAGVRTKVICDPLQSIYSFRGGVTEEVELLREEFHEDDKHHLTGNFRSSPNICKAVATLRPAVARTVDEAVGRYKHETAKVVLIPYKGAGVTAEIGLAFSRVLENAGLIASDCPIVASTLSTAQKAAGLPPAEGGSSKLFRLATLVMQFHASFELGGARTALTHFHQLLLELGGQLGEHTYHQYMSDSRVHQTDWRPAAISAVRKLRWDPELFKDAADWHRHAKEVIGVLLPAGGRSIAQRLPWDSGVGTALGTVVRAGAPPRTIHSVKGKEFPAVCVVTTSRTLPAIISYLQDGEPQDMAEDSRKIYVAASRAERLLVFAVPKKLSTSLLTQLTSSGAEGEITQEV